MSDRPCTCHPDDSPPVPCAKRYALTECKAAAYDVLRQRLRDWHRVADERSAEIVRLSARLAEAEREHKLLDEAHILICQAIAAGNMGDDTPIQTRYAMRQWLEKFANSTADSAMGESQ